MFSTLPYQGHDFYAPIDLRYKKVFTRDGQHGSQVDMSNSYLGIITPRGLETLVVETKHAAMFLLRRVARRPSNDAIVFWAVLDDQTTKSLVRCIERRRFDDALNKLNTDAIHLGPLLPPLDEDSLIRSA